MLPQCSKKYDYYEKINVTLIAVELEYERLTRACAVADTQEQVDKIKIEKENFIWETLELLKTVRCQAEIYIPKQLNTDIVEYKNAMVHLCNFDLITMAEIAESIKKPIDQAHLDKTAQVCKHKKIRDTSWRNMKKALRQLVNGEYKELNHCVVAPQNFIMLQ
jgi:hypothetical protein